MAVLGDRLRAFVAFAQSLKGDEKGEAQSYINALMVAFGHEGAIQAGGAFERRIKGERTTMFADFELPGKVLIEMKKSGENLANHYHQAFNYWLELVPNRPAYVILCNFREIWVYDFNRQLRTPLQKILVERLADSDQHRALRFLEPTATPLKPEFADDHVKVTKEAADLVANVYNSLVGAPGKRPQGNVAPDVAQRYVLQCLVALYSEDAGLLPEHLFESVLKEAVNQKNAYDVVGGLFAQMNNPRPASGGRYKGVDYFNGGLFSVVEPLDLNFGELSNLIRASREFDWDEVEPEIFGTLFQKSMGENARHAYGAHYTSPIDIMKVVTPTIVRPWDRAIAAADGYDALLALRHSLSRYRVLDPACGSGNFLYVAYREVKAIERRLLRRMLDADRRATLEGLARVPFVSTRQFFGMDVLPFAVELAKVTLMLAKELAIMRPEGDDPEVAALVRNVESPLPLDNLDANVLKADALFDPWPAADAIVGNPPYQAKNKLLKEIGAEKLAALRAQYPDVPGRADFCVYFFRRAHDELKPGGRAGLVGTNTIRENYSREGGLDYIVENGGVILDAVASQPWSGDAAVHVSIVNWAKLPEGLLPLECKPGGGTQAADGQMGFALSAENPLTESELHAPKRLGWIEGNKASGTENEQRPMLIGPSLSVGLDVSRAVRLETNAKSKACSQGQTHGHEGFLLTLEQAEKVIGAEPKSKEVLFPFLTADDMLDIVPKSRDAYLWPPRRWVIDFARRDQIAASSYKKPFERLRTMVLPKRQEEAEKERKRNETIEKKGNQHHANFLAHWWQLAYRRTDLMTRLEGMNRYITCSRHIKRPVFDFVSTEIRPNDALVVFPLPDDYSYGIIQSGVHWAWFVARCSTLKGDFRYTSDTVFDAFPWPQSPTPKQCRAVADAAITLRTLRRTLMAEHSLSYRALYRTLETPGKNPLRDAQDALDRTVRAAYGMPADADPLAFLLSLNLELAAEEAAGLPAVGAAAGRKGAVTPPGLPEWIADRDAYVTDDCIRPVPL